MKLLRKINSATAALGWVNGPLYALHRALGRLGGALHRYEFVAQPVAAGPLLPGVRGRSIAVRTVAPDDLALREMPLTPAIIARRAEQGAICFGAFKGERMIGCLWLCLGGYEEDEVRCRFELRPEGRVAWDFDVYLLPEHRLGPSFARLWDAANDFMRHRGIAWSVSRISSYNQRSLAAHARLGAKRIGGAVFVCLGRLQLGFFSVPPFAYLSTGVSRVPRIALEAPPSRVESANPAQSRRTREIAQS